VKHQGREVLLIAPEIVNLRAMPSVGVAYIGSYLRSKGIQVRIVDAQFQKEDPVPVLRQHEQTLVGIAAESQTFDRALKLARVARAHRHITLLGGLHVSLIGEDIMRFPEVDYAIAGDGEIPTHQLLGALDGKCAFADVPGLIFRHPNGTIQHNINTTATTPLDKLPPPDFRLAGIRHMRLYPLVTSRDCPHKCCFCTVGHLSQGRYRGRNPAAAVDELILAKERYGIRGFIVVDENFALKVNRAIEFCELLIEKRLNLPWTAFEGIRAESLTHEFLKVLRASGCRWIFFGIETVENAVLESVQKGNKFEQVKRATELAHTYGLRVGGFLIVGLPNSTFASDMATADWALQNLDRCTFWTAIPYVGTRLSDWVQKNGRLLRPATGPNLINTLSTMPFFETADYSARERKRAHTIANVRSGVRYFVEFLSAEKRAHHHDGEGEFRALALLLTRYAPSLLPTVVPPGSLARFISSRQQDSRPSGTSAEPLTGDLLGELAVPRDRFPNCAAPEAHAGSET
jgi:anaerobic magnesium-protoporphyrin IX monomethyl ester cyclase